MNKIVWKILKSPIKTIKAIYYFVTIIKDIKMSKDLKTTITAIIKAVLIVLGIFGINVSPESSQVIMTAILSIYALIEIIQGWFTKDKEKNE